MKVVEKAWGREEILVNEPEYCAKLLYVNAGWQCSLHYHRLKKETFIIKSGVVELECDGYNATYRIGDSCTILPEMPHRFAAVQPAVILEVSTHHDDADVYRIEESRKL